MAGQGSFPRECKQPIVDQHDAPDQVTTHIHTGPVAVGWHNSCFWFCVEQSAAANIIFLCLWFFIGNYCRYEAAAAAAAAAAT